MSEGPKGSDPRYRGYAILSTITIEMLVLTGGGVLLGSWLSSAHGFPDWTLALTASVGLFLAIFRMITIHAKPKDD